MSLTQQEEMTKKLNTASHAKLIDKLRIRIEHAEQKSGGFFAVNFCAPHGYAKSALLAHVWDTFEKRMPICLVHLKKLMVPGESFDRSKLLEGMYRDLIFRVTPQILEESGIAVSDANSKDLDQLTAGLVALIKAAARHHQVSLFLIDDYDLFRAEDRRWFESQMLGQLSSVARFGVIMTSLAPLRFDRLDLRAGLQIYPLARLTAEDVAHAFPQYSDLSPQIERLTGGLPTLTGELIADLEESPQKLFELRERRNGLIRKCLREHVEGAILGNVAPDIRKTLQVLALLRRFDVPTLAALLPKVLPDVYVSELMFKYVNLLAELNIWTQWRADGGYALNEAYALALRGYVIAERPYFWQRVHQESRDHYRGLLVSGQYQRYYVAEALFHRLCLLQAEGKSDEYLQKTISDDLLAILQAEATATTVAADAGLLRETLWNDRDLAFFISTEALDKLSDLERASVKTKPILSLARAA